jgi:enoyl-CoA hydratase/carnithine racemase
MDFVGETLSWRHHGPAVEVELRRAPLNEIGTTTLHELEVLADYVRGGAGGARALVWWSSRPGFCAGADLRELHAGLLSRRQGQVDAAKALVDRLGPAKGLAGRGLRRATAPLIRREVRRFIDRVHAVMDCFDQAPITTIAVTHGVVFGGGFELALTADLIIAEKSSRFCFPELRLGIVPGFGGIPRLRRDLGDALVRDLLLTGRSLNASRAQEVGLVSQVVPKGTGLDAARRVAEQAAKFDAHAAAAAKAFAKPHPREELLAERELFCALITRPAVFEALQRFVDDRSPQPYLP